MNINLVQPVFLGQLQQTEQVINVAVNAAVGQQAHQVQGGTVLLAVFHRAQQGRVFKKVPVLNRLGDAGQLLVDDAARTDVGVANLRVAHLPVRKADIKAGSADLGVGVLGKIFVEVRLFGGMDGVAVVGVVDAETVEDH